MLIDPQNKLIQSQIMDLTMKRIQGLWVQRITITHAQNYNIRKMVNCFYHLLIFSRAGNYMIDKYCKDYTKEATEVGFHLTFSFDNQYAKEEPKIPKNATEAEKAEIQELKLQIREENQKLFEKVTKDFSQIRRNLYAAVFEQAFDQVNKGETSPKFKYQSRENEVVYAIPDKDVLNIALKYHFLIMQIEHQLLLQLQRQFNQLVEQNKQIFYSQMIVSISYVNIFTIMKYQLQLIFFLKSISEPFNYQFLYVIKLDTIKIYNYLQNKHILKQLMFIDQQFTILPILLILKYLIKSNISSILIIVFSICNHYSEKYALLNKRILDVIIIYLKDKSIQYQLDNDNPQLLIQDIFDVI
ncbi:unnamed protein product [Paramecium primaurelia]|uniref:Uncharacterized protein n=1 Tax=Paramecium primaurelia TaxID=5886 RepID=A0A8S1PDX5_PARPR|nr:unnamed protein product [Paramecium primaurelia]